MNKHNYNVSTKRRIESLIIILFCAALTAGVVSVLMFIYEPKSNSLGALGTVCMDVISMAVLLILSLGVVFEKGRLSRTTKWFLLVMLGTMTGLFFDFLNWAYDGTLEYGSLTYVYTMLSLCMGSVLACLFIGYLSVYFEDMYKIRSAKVNALICIVFDLISFVITLILGITNKAFVFENGHYSPGPYYSLVTTIPVVTLVYMTIYAIVHIKTVGFHDVLAVIGYISIMVLGALVEEDYGVGATYVGVALSDVFIFMMLQNKLIDRVKKQSESLTEKINEEKRNVEKWIRRSHTDEMTGFYNRQAYETEISNLEKAGIKDNFVYISMDVNGLKMVNDTMGHEAGDELIVGACECMRLCLGSYGKLFRTGGDEFVAILYADETQLAEMKRDIVNVASKWHGKYIDSLNISYGFVAEKEARNMTLHQVAVLADKRMYEDKTRYYRKRGVDRRGQRDAHVALVALYSKILKINVTEDRYEIVNIDESEKTLDKGFNEKLSLWLRDFAISGQVHPEDSSEYLEKTNIVYISEYFKTNEEPFRIIYRRRIGDDYKRVMMEIIKANDYRNDSQNLFLYVKEI